MKGFSNYKWVVRFIEGSHAIYRISLSSVGPQMNRSRLIDEVSVYLKDQSICHITLLYNNNNNSNNEE